jgi:hypothetical protein
MPAREQFVCAAWPKGVKTVTYYYGDGECWHRWIAANSMDDAMEHVEPRYYSGPGRGWAIPVLRIEHPRKVVLFQRGGLDI